MNEQQINQMRFELDALAQTIRHDQNQLAATNAAHAEANDELDRMESAMLGQVLNDRFALNNKLKYTNDAQRQSRLREMQQADADYQAMKTARAVLTERKAREFAIVQERQNMYRTRLLVLEYHAKAQNALPTAPPALPATAEPPAAGAPVSFENVAGFEVAAGNSVARLAAGAYFGTAQTFETIAGDGWFSWRYNDVFASVVVQFSDEARVFSLTASAGGTLAARFDGVYEADIEAANARADNASVFKLARAAGVVKLYKNAAHIYTFANPSHGAARLFVKAQNEPESTGGGINSVTAGGV